MNKQYTMHVISGTHWDREWRYSAEQSKLRLVDLMDSVLEILEQKSSFRSFCIDGGMVAVEDYLTLRPENNARIKALVENGKLKLMSWYTLPDMFTVSPESIIRNITLGRQMANSFGGAMAAGYTSCSYGQTSQLPQIYRGFGIDTALYYRGTNQYELPSLFLWKGMDGSELHTVRTFDDITRANWYFNVHYPLVLGKDFLDLSYKFNKNEQPCHLCDGESYERPFALLHEDGTFKNDAASLKKALDAIRRHAEPFAIGRHMLALNIEDNARPYEPMPEIIDALNAISPDIDIVQSSFDEYFSAILGDHGNDDLFVHNGEARFPGVAPGFNGLYGATHSSRVKLKLMNDKAETALINFAEPLASIGSNLGFEYPASALARAWRVLLQNHAHDSICGAAIDRAHEDMIYRFSTAETVGLEVAARSLAFLQSKIDTASHFSGSDYTITFFNTLAVERDEIVQIVADIPECTDMEHFDIVDENGNIVEHKIQSVDSARVAVERELDTSTWFSSRRWRILIRARVPAMGYTTYAIRPRKPVLIEHPISTERKLIAGAGGTLENEHMKVQINSNGTFNIYSKDTGREFRNLHYFTDYGQTGSAHLSVTPRRNPVVTSLGGSADIIMEQSSTLRGEYRIDLCMRIPAAATQDNGDRLREMKDLPISTRLILDKGSKVLKIKTRLSNSSRDHKLQINFPTCVDTNFAVAESAFAIEKRDFRWRETGDNLEECYTFQPMMNFVDINDGQIGLSFLSKGLREYEITDDPDRNLAITLLRTHRDYMTANREMNPDELDRYTGMHSFGDFSYDYALYPHAGDHVDADTLHTAYAHKIGIRAVQGIPHPGDLPCSASFFTVKPADKIMVSALKQSEDRSGTILRLWNMSGEKLKASVKTLLPLESATRVRMDETIIEPLPFEGGIFSLNLEPHKIESILLTPYGQSDEVESKYGMDGRKLN